MMFMGPHIRIRDVGMQLYWHLGEFFFQSAVTLITFIAAATVLWRNVGNNQQSPLLTALSSGYMALLLYAIIRFSYGMYRRSRALKDVPGPDYPLLTGKLDLLSMRDMHRFCTESAEKYGPIFKWRLFTFHAVVITDPVLATQILRNKAVDKLRFMYSFLDVTIVWNLLGHIKAVRPQRGSFADLLLRAKDPKSGKPLSDNQMFPEIAALFFAGIDTTGHTATFFLYMMSQHPEVEAKIIAELDSLGLSITPQRQHPRKMTYADLNKLTYLNATIKEVLRMYPPVGVGQIRVAEKHDIVLGGKSHIPAGTILWIPHHAIQNVSFNWDDHDKFLPERWLTPGTEYAVTEKLPLPKDWYTDMETEAIAPGATNLMSTASLPANYEYDESSDSKRPKRYFPFAEGPRSCVGQSLAKVSLVATMATLMQHFHFCLADESGKKSAWWGTIATISSSFTFASLIEMGGPEGVRKSEQYTLVIGLKNGMSMHAVPRPGVMESLCNGSSANSNPAAQHGTADGTSAWSLEQDA